MTSKNHLGGHEPLTVIAVKAVLARVNGEISMRSVTAAIRQYCLEGQHNARDRLLAFFLACESRLKRSTQQEWNRVIDHEIRKMVGLERLARFLAIHSCSAALAKLG